MPLCTDFCTSIGTVDFRKDAILAREELIKRLPITGTEGISEWPLGTWDELQRRTDCEVCKLVITAIAESLQADDSGAVSPEQIANILLLPDETSFRLSFPSPLSARLAFVSSDASTSLSPDTARLIRREGVDVTRVKSWLQACDENHPSCSWRNSTAPCGRNRDDECIEMLSKVPFKGSFNEKATSNFRVIDIERGCVEHAPLDTKYVALSYVWGQLPMVQLRKDNFEALTREGTLETFRQQLPRTINDAIDLLEALGLRYLWIDGLCLIQDDPDDVSLGVSMMNSIYHGSYFTIVAAAGQDANSGLPGVQQGLVWPAREQKIARLSSGVQLTVTHSVDWHLSRSTHNERGWTMQELVLPDRTLVFVNGQAYFRCHEANWSEETWADKWPQWLDADDSNISRLPDPVEGFLPSCWAYQKLCENYSQRKLRNDGDALRAMQGILRPTAAGMDTDLVEGLPGYFLDHFLLFISCAGQMRRRPGFASFSWAGWDGPKMWPRENFEWPEVTPEGRSISKRQTENVLNYFEHNRLVEWASVGRDAHVETLTHHEYDTPSLLLELMQRHPTSFPESTEDPVVTARREAASRFGGESVSSSVPRWGSWSYDWGDETHVDPGAGVHKKKPLPEFCMKALDLAYGQAEFDRLIDRMTDRRAKLAMCNWMAVRRIRGSKPVYK